MEYMRISYQKETERSSDKKRWTVIHQVDVASLSKRDVSVTRVSRLIRVICQNLPLSLKDLVSFVSHLDSRQLKLETRSQLAYHSPYSASCS